LTADEHCPSALVLSAAIVSYGVAC